MKIRRVSINPLAGAMFAVGLVFAGCDSQGPEPSAEASTWDVVQSEILTPECAGCHAAGTSFAVQSDLVLTADAAYDELVGVEPHNAAARADGLVRVSTEGVAGLERSFLWEKIDARNQDHFYEDHPGYGAIMPLGGRPLTNGMIELIGQWIAAGAPETGTVVDAADLLADTTRYEPDAPFVPLDPPARGLHFRLGPFEVAPRFERELFYFEPATWTEDQYVTRIQASMRPGSHHFLLYLLNDDVPENVRPAPNVIRDIRTPEGQYDLANIAVMLHHSFFGGTQWPFMDYSFPEGVALRLPAGKGLDLNAHYVNATDTPAEGEVHVSLHTADRADVARVAERMALNNLDFELPPRQVTTVTRTYTFREPRQVFMLFSHAHKHMTSFRVMIAGGPRDGELVYATTDWEHPPILDYDPPLALEAGQGFRLEATYDNDTDRTLRFGLLSEDEMMILFGYYY